MTNLLEVRDVVRSFGGVRAVDRASLDVDAGSITSLIGPNGAGKSTLFNIVSGFLRADEGTVSFEGRRIDRLPPHRIAQARPTPPRMRIIQAKKVSSGAKSAGLKNENCHA